MPTLAASPSLSPSPPSAPPAGPAGRPSWRALALLTLAVALAHLLLLGLAPASLGEEPSPLADRFITRTIVIAPPAVDKPAAAPAAPAAQARPAPAARPRRPREPSRPRPQTAAPQPAPQPAPEIAQQVPEAPPAAAADPAPATPDAVPASDPAPTTASAAAPAPAAAIGTDTGDAPTAAGASNPAIGNMAGTQSLRIPGSVKLSFAATGQRGASPMQGVFGTLQWLQDGQAYDAQLTLKLLFKTLVEQHSTGRIGPSGIEPARYSESRKGEIAAHFLRDQGQIMFSNNAPATPLLAGAQDRLSVVMQLGGLLAGDPARYPAGSQITVQTAGTREAGLWTFNIEGQEKITVQAGDFMARKLTRSPRQPYDVKLELWLAPEIGYLPVRIRQTQPNGDFADMELRESLPAGPGS